ncbi:hypothetical protein ACEPPN_006476 [Leptodophora sp. 'Broadleaf-Isolate-01']
MKSFLYKYEAKYGSKEDSREEDSSEEDSSEEDGSEAMGSEGAGEVGSSKETKAVAAQVRLMLPSMEIALRVLEWTETTQKSPYCSQVSLRAKGRS